MDMPIIFIGELSVFLWVLFKYIVCNTCYYKQCFDEHLRNLNLLEHLYYSLSFNLLKFNY